MERLYRAYKNDAQFFLVYIREAHPSPPTSQPTSRAGERAGARVGERAGELAAARRAARGGVQIAPHANIDDRMAAADNCSKDLGLTIPVLLDSMDGAAERAYQGWPAGTAVIDVDGRIALWVRGNPNGCRPDEAEKALNQLLANANADTNAGRLPALAAATRPASAPASQRP